MSDDSKSSKKKKVRRLFSDDGRIVANSDDG